MNVLGIIPARGGSKRLPGKNIRLFCGKPLIQWAIDNSLETKLINRVVISSDSDDILKLSSLYKQEKVMFLKRPEEISKDTSSAIEYVQNALESMEHINENFDAVAIIQPTSPLTLPEDIDNTISLLLNSNADSAVSIVKLAHDINPLKLKVLSGDKLFPYLEEEEGRMSCEAVPEVYIRNGSVYAASIGTINDGNIIGKDCRGYVMPRERSVDINDEFDFCFAEYLHSQKPSFS